MKVIIKKTNEVKDVSLGHALNYLLPQGLAVAATKKKLEELEAKRVADKKALKEDKVSLRRQAERIDGKVIGLALKVGKDGKAYGSITKKEIAEELKIEKNYVVLDKPIKKEGEYEVKLAFGKSGAKVKVKVKAS